MLDATSLEVPIVATGEFTTTQLRDLGGVAREAWHCIIWLLVLAGSAVAAIAAVVQLAQKMWYLSWIVLSAFYPLGQMATYLWARLRAAHMDGCFAVVHVRSNNSNRFVIEAMNRLLRQIAVHGEAELTLERVDQEKSDKDVSGWKAMLRPWNQRAYLHVAKGSASYLIELASTTGEGVVCGPKHELTHPVDFLVCVQASSVLELLVLACSLEPQRDAMRLVTRQKVAMSFLRAWLDDVYRDYVRTSVGMVEVLELQQDSKDWPPEWQSVRRERAVRRAAEASSGAPPQDAPVRGATFYAVEKWAGRLLLHGEFAVKHTSRLRTALFLHGQKGSGKTLFVEWLASELALPIYYIDLRSPCLDDSALRDAITPRKLRHNLPVIIHIDEFQVMINAWLDRHLSNGDATAPQARDSPIRVTIQGLQCLLEGIGTPNNALFVFTSSRDLPAEEELKDLSEEMRHEWYGLLRRFPEGCRECIPPVSKKAALDFFSCFLATYLPTGVDTSMWESSAKQLVEAWSFDAQQAVPYDMLAKYCEQQLRDAFIRGFVVSDGGDGHMSVPRDSVDAFLGVIFDSAALTAWPASYAGGRRQSITSGGLDISPRNTVTG